LSCYQNYPSMTTALLQTAVPTNFRGEVEIVTPDGIVLSRQKNLVVDMRRPLTLRALAGVNPDIYSIRYIALGDGKSQPKAEDTSLEHELIRLEISSYTFPNEQSVVFEAYMDYSVGNGKTFTEAGLVTPVSEAYPQGMLFARTLLKKPITKDETFAFYIRWKITLL